MVDNHFRTSDTGLATFLVTQGYTIATIDYSQPRYEYIFSNSVPLRELATKYLIGEARADPAALLRVNKKLLRIIKNGRQWEDD